MQHEVARYCGAEAERVGVKTRGVVDAFKESCLASLAEELCKGWRFFPTYAHV
jgi:hypothetical protein